MSRASPSSPLVSAVMPVYNAEQYVAEAIEGVLAQTLTSFEFVIVDDGSTHDSLDIVANYARKDPRIRLSRGNHHGIGHARNVGARLARGEFIAVVDADDVSCPQRFLAEARFLQEHPDYVAVGGKVLFVDPDGEPLCESELYKQTSEEIDAAHLRCDSGAISHPSAMLRKSALEAVGGYREDFQIAHDLDLFLRLAEVGKLGNVPRVLIHYRQHVGSICHTKTAQMVREIDTAVREALTRRGMAERPRAVTHSPEALSVAQQRRKWAWWALGAGHLATARKHAFATLRRAPLSRKSWQLAACAIRGY